MNKLFFWVALATGPFFTSTALAKDPIFSVGPPIVENSGAVYDHENGLLYTMGDSGNDPVIGVTDLETLTTSTLRISNASNKDWEALVRDHQGYLWILDTGDNDKERSFVTAYRVDPSRAREGVIHSSRVLHFFYPDGAHDVEAAALDGHDLYLFEKRYTGRPRVYRASISKHAEDAQIVERVSRLKWTGPITDATVSPNGTLYLLTYIGITEVKRWPSDSMKARRVKSGYWGQAESLAATPGGNLWVGNEDGNFYLIEL